MRSDAAIRIIECKEHDPISIPIDDLFLDGEIVLDARIADRGYLDVSIKGRRVHLRSTRFVGLIPLNSRIALRISPKARIGNLSHMIVRCGEVPTVLPDFARGYRPKFEVNEKAEETYHNTFLGAVAKIAEKGLLKSYVAVPNPPKWRGRLLVGETVNRYVSRGIRYAGAFEYKTLSVDVAENVVIKEGLVAVNAWLLKERPRDPLCHLSQQLLEAFSAVNRWNGPIARLIEDIPWRANALPVHQSYYKEPLWTAYVLLQRMLPDIGEDGFISLNSMVVDVSKVFEAYMRRLLVEAAPSIGVRVFDGNKRPSLFFRDDKTYKVKPDIVVEKNGTVSVVLDVKYKPFPKESDRYEVLSFLEATGTKRAAFICPATDGHEASQYMGRTLGGREMAIIRIDLAAENLQREEKRFIRNIVRLLDGKYNFEQGREL